MRTISAKEVFDVSSKERVSIKCEVCGSVVCRKVNSIRTNVKVNNGSYVCHRCKLNSDEYVQKQKKSHPKSGSKWDNKTNTTCSVCGSAMVMNHRSFMYIKSHQKPAICRSCSIKRAHEDGKFDNVYTKDFCRKLKNAGESGRIKSAEWWTDAHRSDAFIEFVRRANDIHNHKYDYSESRYINYHSKIQIYCSVHGYFYQTPEVHLKGSGCQKCSMIITRGHQEIVDYLRSIGVASIEVNDRNQISPLELDIFIPDLRLAIEYHGLYWHSYGSLESSVEKQRHSHKKDMCVDKSIQLCQVQENEWKHKQDIVKSVLLNKCGQSKRIYARKCSVALLDYGAYRDFMNRCHLQGAKNAHVFYGLIYDESIVASMSFNKHSKYGWEITRFANDLGTTVVGGAGKLFKRFINDYNPKMILTYADRRYSSGNLYSCLGFQLVGITHPNYFYVKNDKLYSRHKFQKHKLQNLLDHFDSNLTEVENMFNNGYRRLWDAGHWRFLWASDGPQQSIL